MAVGSDGRYVNNVHIALNRYANTSSLNFYGLNAPTDAKPTMSKH